MSADDATARWLDEQLDLALAQGGTLPPELVDSELGEVIQLFAADAVQLDEMSDASGVRRRVLEQMGDEQQAAAGAGFVGSLLRGTGRGAGVGARGAGWSAGRAWRARKVVMVAGCMVVLCTTLAYADTSTPAGRIVRTAARTLQIPVPAEPKTDAERREDKQAREDARQGASGDDRRGDRERAGEDGRDPSATGESGVAIPGEPGELGENGEPMHDGMFEPGEQPLPPMGDRPLDGSAPRPGSQLPLDGGATQPAPNPDGSVPPPPTGEQPPAGQQPPPGGTAPAPGGTRPPAPRPDGTAPQPLPGTQPPPPSAPRPQPAPQPQPIQPAPAPQPAP